MPFETFERDLRLATAGLQPAEIDKMLAAFARSELAEVIASGEGTKNYDRFVNGRRGAAEETVRAPGPILYVFNWWDDVINAAFEELEKRSPRKTGRYAGSFIVISNGQLVTDYSGLRGDTEVIITNFQPYVRKIEARDKKVFAGAKLALARRFGNSYRVEIRFLSIAAGVHPSIPYILKGEYARLRNARIANPARFPGQSFPRRKDQEPGQPITYPALIINAL
ncbi:MULTISPECIES: hypothetical protein [unclassified Mesorhizobium]|uniref:hypothetical protein n=1 Tax=unclassified Mesorhizobium TaxID=325217 RepID=UPI001FE21C7B|nr:MULTISPECIES: hypothetical protein [unclassified Mesorhizobium]